MATKLATNYSKSNPGKSYDILEGADGIVYCECPGWKMSKDSPKMCRHLREYVLYGSKRMDTNPPPKLVIRPVTSEKTLADAVALAVATINGRK